MSSKTLKKSTKQGVKSGSSVKDKLRPFYLLGLFAIGGVIAYWINSTGLMSETGSEFNFGIKRVFWIEILTYLAIIGFIIVGYKFQELIDKRNVLKK